ncbi:MerR family transcriptional regulator [Pelomonas sp. KK5]|uniref:MerR family transcriptional regulator n=1 Tax=Pelomonas sp. KK5 TaxID=1855730 RepID=UPI00097BE343|nr:MerR family transcriptional regulator [Pelomonas sp. KK5]
MRIGHLAAATGVSRDTLRFYEDQGLIRSRRLENGYRDYPDEARLLVDYIRTAQKLGFTLAEIGNRLPAVWHAAEPGPAIRQLLTEKLHDIDARIDGLRALREQLALRVKLDCPLVNGTLAPS